MEVIKETLKHKGEENCEAIIVNKLLKRYL